MRVITRIIGLTALTAALPLLAAANEPRMHDGGFFLRVQPGIASASTSSEQFGDEISISGVAGSFDAAIGFVITDNLALHGNLGGWSMLDPTIEFDGQEEESEDTTVSLTSFGVGATYYFGESNFYVSGGLGIAQLSADFGDGDEAETDSGLAFEVGAGKEWWMGDTFAIGVGVALQRHSVDEEILGQTETWSGTTFSVRFNATLN